MTVLSTVVSLAVAQSQRLTASEIKAAVAGNSLVGYWQNAEIKEHFGADGVSVRQRERGELVTGRWHVDAERVADDR